MRCFLSISCLLAALSLSGLIFISYAASKEGSWLSRRLKNNTLQSVSKSHPIPLQPADWAFMIWGLIYALQIIWVSSSLIASILSHEYRMLLCPKSILSFSVSNVLLGVWCYTFLREMMFSSFALLLSASLLLGYSLIRVYDKMRKAKKYTAKCFQKFIRIFMTGGLGIYYGWCIVATTIAMQLTMKYSLLISDEASSFCCLLFLVANAFLYSLAVRSESVLFNAPYLVYLYGLAGIISQCVKDAVAMEIVYGLIVCFGVILAILIVQLVSVCFKRAEKFDEELLEE